MVNNLRWEAPIRVICPSTWDLTANKHKLRFLVQETMCLQVRRRDQRPLSAAEHGARLT